MKAKTAAAAMPGAARGTAIIHIAFREIGRDQKLFRIVMREGDNFPELRDRFYDRIVRRGHVQAAGFSSDDSIEDIIAFIRREFVAATAG